MPHALHTYAIHAARAAMNAQELSRHSVSRVTSHFTAKRAVKFCFHIALPFTVLDSATAA